MCGDTLPPSHTAHMGWVAAIMPAEITYGSNFVRLIPEGNGRVVAPLESSSSGNVKEGILISEDTYLPTLGMVLYKLCEQHPHTTQYTPGQTPPTHLKN